MLYTAIAGAIMVVAQEAPHWEAVFKPSGTSEFLGHGGLPFTPVENRLNPYSWLPQEPIITSLGELLGITIAGRDDDWSGPFGNGPWPQYPFLKVTHDVSLDYELQWWPGSPAGEPPTRLYYRAAFGGTVTAGSGRSLSVWGEGGVDGENSMTLTKTKFGQFTPGGQPGLFKLEGIGMSSSGAWVVWDGYPQAHMFVHIMPLANPRFAGAAHTANYRYDPAAPIEDLYMVENKPDGNGDRTIDVAVQWYQAEYWQKLLDSTIVQTAHSSPKYRLTGVAAFEGFTSTGTWAPSPEGQWIPYSVTALRSTFVPGPPSAVLGQTDSIMGEVREGTDSSTAMPTYMTVRWHWPYENWEEFATHQFVWQQGNVTNVDNPGYAILGGSIGLEYDSYNQPMFMSIAAAPGSLLLEMSGAVTPPLYSALLAELGYAWNYVGEQLIKQGSAVFNSCWGDEHATYFPDANGEPAEYKMYPTYWERYRHRFWKGEAYGATGFKGLRSAATMNLVGLKFSGDFTYDPNGGSGPPSPGGP